MRWRGVISRVACGERLEEGLRVKVEAAAEDVNGVGVREDMYCAKSKEFRVGLARKCRVRGRGHVIYLTPTRVAHCAINNFFILSITEKQLPNSTPCLESLVNTKCHVVILSHMPHFWLLKNVNMVLRLIQSN